MMSSGLPRDQLAGSAPSSAASVAGDSPAMRTPRSTARSVAITPGPPPLVTMARRLPLGRMWLDSARAAANSCKMVLTRTTPARRTSASNTASDPTSAPVCDCTAFDPAS